ncbi:glycosyltransferase family 1 protein [Danxiaibacter flavus]|uniref:Glycosyltransferase family 1 protein n=1 Tax=Danxiaibacter flavus TaxID=3049108 RepID=A0ABV3ZJD5_9BACT|nr:glycosyltransferase family 1 protein [Chitinophagaceae bacterium DXS]
MNIIIFSHPLFFSSNSMPRYTRMIAQEMRNRGHDVEVWIPEAHTVNWTHLGYLKKWLGYIDMYLLFPAEVKKRLKHTPAKTLFVFSDQALGMWVPLVANRPHIIHCHDFMAQKSGMGLLAEHHTSWTGKIYQRMIRNGYSKGRHFISVSYNTAKDLQNMPGCKPETSSVVYNAVSPDFKALNKQEARVHVAGQIKLQSEINLSQGYLLHVGNNAWYKNQQGVLQIYNAWRKLSKPALPLVIVGNKPDNIDSLNEPIINLWKNDIIFITGISDQLLAKIYGGASMLLFPSLEEGFGWPIAEAMACGCPVITTNKSPMNEVGGDAAWYIPRMPSTTNTIKQWACNAAITVNTILSLSKEQEISATKAGLLNAERFTLPVMMDAIEKIYGNTLGCYMKSKLPKRAPQTF